MNDSNWVAPVLFILFISLTLGITYWASRRNHSVESHLVAEGAISGRANGVAIAGDLISAATFLGTTGAIAMVGFNGFYLAVWIPVAFFLMLVLVAEPLRNLGRFTLGDVLATRFDSRGVRGSIGVGAIIVSLLYMVGQFVGAALLVQLLFGIDYVAAAVVIAVLTTLYTFFGGMIATTYIQIVKTVLLLITGVILIIWVFAKFGWNPASIFRSANEMSDGNLLRPVRKGPAAQVEQFSLILGVTLGALGLPHILVRFLTVPDAKEARTSAVTSIWIFAGFLIFLPFLSFAAVEFFGGSEKLAKVAGASGNLTAIVLAEYLGGNFMLAFIAAVTTLIILSALAGLVIATSGAVSHDLYAKILKDGNVTPKEQLLVARGTILVAGIIVTLIAIAAREQNVAFLTTLAIAVAASAMMPALLLTMYWRKTTAPGVVWGMVAGLVSALAIILTSPTLLGESAISPITSPAIISMPIGFIVMYLVSLATQPKGQDAVVADGRFGRIRIQSVTGVDTGDPALTAESERIQA